MPAPVQTIKLEAKDHDIELLLPTGRRLLLQYREESGLVDICFKPTGLTVWQGDDVSGSLCSANAWQLCIGVHRDHKGEG